MDFKKKRDRDSDKLENYVQIQPAGVFFSPSHSKGWIQIIPLHPVYICPCVLFKQVIIKVITVILGKQAPLTHTAAESLRFRTNEAVEAQMNISQPVDEEVEPAFNQLDKKVKYL